jgi:hypothetical protein
VITLDFPKFGFSPIGDLLRFNNLASEIGLRLSFLPVAPMAHLSEKGCAEGIRSKRALAAAKPSARSFSSE